LHLKTFTAKSMPEALAQVKLGLGKDAVILHTRTYKRGGILGFGARVVVEITAAQGRDVGRPRRAAQRPTTRAVSPVTRDTVTISSEAKTKTGDKAIDQSAGDLIRKTYLAAQAELQRSRGSHADSDCRGGTATLAPPATTTTALESQTITSNRESAAAADDLAVEVQTVKRMVAKMVRQQRERLTQPMTKSAGATCDLPDKLFDQYLSLLQQEVTEELAEEVIQQVRSDLTPAEMNDEKEVRRAVFKAISQFVPIDDSAEKQTRTADGRPLTIALIGPTGVGKTTTIAKLAANFKLREKKKVGLITIDTYRIAAVDQLRTYASIIGVPLEVISQPQDMAKALAKCAHCDVVLIDTAGRSQRDDPKLEQLSAFIAAADPHEVHLVLSSTCTQSALMDIVDRFNRLRVDRIIFTKLDEAVTFGVLLNVTRKVNKKLSYFTTGQEVPHQIEPGRSDRLAALVLGEGI